jgi:cation transport regulator
MTYIKLSDLPLSVRKELPPDAQEIYKAVYNRTWEQCSASEDYDPRNTAEIAGKAALLAVEAEYERDEHGRWRKASISKVLDTRKIRPQG